MKIAQLAAAALFLSTTGAFAMGGGAPSPFSTWYPQGPHYSQRDIGEMTRSLGPTNSSHLERSPASCAPDGADPVWGANQEMLGFSCHSASQGGS